MRRAAVQAPAWAALFDNVRTFEGVGDRTLVFGAVVCAGGRKQDQGHLDGTGPGVGPLAPDIEDPARSSSIIVNDGKVRKYTLR
jgi:hypothetical protein